MVLPWNDGHHLSDLCRVDASAAGGVGRRHQLVSTSFLTSVSLAQHGVENGDVEDNDDQQTDDVHGDVRSLVVPDKRVVHDQIVGLAESDVDVHQHAVSRLSPTIPTCTSSQAYT